MNFKEVHFTENPWRYCKKVHSVKYVILHGKPCMYIQIKTTYRNHSDTVKRFTKRLWRYYIEIHTETMYIASPYIDRNSWR